MESISAISKSHSLSSFSEASSCGNDEDSCISGLSSHTHQEKIPDNGGCVAIDSIKPDTCSRKRFCTRKGGVRVKWVKAILKGGSSFSASLHHGGSTGGLRRRSHERNSGNSVQGLGLSVGMSMAAVIEQVLHSKSGASGESFSADFLSRVCVSAVKESVTNVCGNHFDSFICNFEKSFKCTLKTLRLINEVAVQKPACTNSIAGEAFVIAPCEPSRHEGITDAADAHLSYQMVVHGATNEQIIPTSISGSNATTSILSTWEKSIAEQARCNDLKTMEIALNMERLKLDRTRLDLQSSTNYLERFKISMNMSKAAFKEGKFKTQLLDSMHEEFGKKCTDCLLAGLLIMCACLLYGVFVHSYDRLAEATSSCSQPSKMYRSWWVPSTMTSISEGIDLIRCHAIVLSRMLFGLMMIAAVAYSLFQRSATSSQTLPITFIMLILAFVCGIAGKLCIDSLGGSGFCWFYYWESICLLHLLSAIFKPPICSFLYGPVHVVPEVVAKRAFPPYSARRIAFYGSLFILPAFCGLLPFASAADWKEHFSSKLEKWFGN